LTQAADRINAYAAEHGLDPAGKAPMTGPRLCELENFPTSRVRRLTPQTLALLAGVYGTDVHALVDLDDHERLDPSDRLSSTAWAPRRRPHLIARVRRGARLRQWPQPSPLLVDHKRTGGPPCSLILRPGRLSRRRDRTGLPRNALATSAISPDLWIW